MIKKAKNLCVYVVKKSGEPFHNDKKSKKSMCLCVYVVKKSSEEQNFSYFCAGISR
jgi:hypothetical protein